MDTPRDRSGRNSSRGGAPRKLAAVAGVLVLGLLLGAARAEAGKGAYLGGWSLSGGVGYANPNTDEYGDSLAWRVGAGYSPLPGFEIGLELGRFSVGVSQPEADGVPTHDIASGRLEVQPVCLALQLHLPLAPTLAIFNLQAGAGRYFIDYSMAGAPRAFFASNGGAGLPDQEVRDAWGFHAGAGLEYALNSWFSLTIEGRYVLLAPHVSGTARDDATLDRSLNLNTWLFTGGMKVAF